MAAAFPLAAVVLASLGAVFLYRGAPRQQWRARPWPARPSRVGGGALLLAGWLSWCVVLQPVTAFFAVLTVAMVAFTLVPALAVAFRPPGKG